jgi:hypothetical protein
MKPLYIVLDNIPVPDWLFEQALCEPNKEYIETPEIQAFTNECILPLVKTHVQADPSLEACSNHVHISAAGLTPHDHLPHAFTSVFYIVDAEGELVVDPCGLGELITPRAGRLVIFPGHVVHSVNKSPHDELRISLVTNYEYPSV